ncbi:hypothetical protein KBX08_32775, partial [Micromonospora sp. H61]|nr:hypothetical protein [Micromonospora sp. H61]
MSNEQRVTASAGYAYGVIGADLLIFTDRGPVYHLASPDAPAEPAGDWFLEQPSRLLNARFRIVDFVGHDEIDDLVRWRDSTARIAVRWIGGPGGSGKSRLAAEIAAVSRVQGWKIVTVTHGVGAVLPPAGSVDLRLDGYSGVLLVVDYADRWPMSHLTWLLSNALLHQPACARILLLGRSIVPWLPLRAELENLWSAHDLVQL